MPTHLVRFDIGSGKIAPITDPPKTIIGDDQPRYSPDGRYLVYLRNLDGERSDIRLKRMSDGYERIVDKFKGCVGSAAWAPDGTAILASRDCPGSYSLWAYPVGAGEAREVFASTSGIGRFSVNPNGTVAMETFGGHVPISAFKRNSNKPATPLDEAGGLTSDCADFAPDGALVVTGRIGTNFGVWIADRQGAPFRKLMSLPQWACGIRWSPDGTRFAFIQSGSAGGFEIPVVRRDGEVVTRIDYAGTNTNLFDWTADGKSILTSRLQKEGWRIWRTNLATPDKAVPVTPLGWIDPRVHGSMLFAEKYGVVGTWRLDTGTPMRVADGPTLESSDLLTISGDRLYFADMTDPKHPAIAAQSVYGGDKKRLIPLPFGRVNFTFAVNPKSGDIVFSSPPADDSDIGLMRLQRR
jgi:dipeptidyl aminopeptidase/acylaminoacyl peptidase